jgi:hypothetical protein
MEEDSTPAAPQELTEEENRMDREGGPSQPRSQGRKRKLVLAVEGEEEPEGLDTTPEKKKGPARRKVTPLNKRPKEAGEDEEETGDEGDQEQGMPAGAEPVQEAGPSGNEPAERREPLQMEDMLLQQGCSDVGTRTFASGRPLDVDVPIPASSDFEKPTADGGFTTADGGFTSADGVRTANGAIRRLDRSDGGFC